MTSDPGSWIGTEPFRHHPFSLWLAVIGAVELGGELRRAHEPAGLAAVAEPLRQAESEARGAATRVGGGMQRKRPPAVETAVWIGRGLRTEAAGGSKKQGRKKESRDRGRPAEARQVDPRAGAAKSESRSVAVPSNLDWSRRCRLARCGRCACWRRSAPNAPGITGIPTDSRTSRIPRAPARLRGLLRAIGH